MGLSRFRSLDCPLLSADCDRTSKSRLYLAKYLSKFVTKYRPKLRALRTRLHPHLRRSLHLNLNLDLCPDLNLNLNLNLGLPLLQTFFQQLFVPLLGSFLLVLALDFWLLIFDFEYRPLLPPRQPLGRPLPVRIVV